MENVEKQLLEWKESWTGMTVEIPVKSFSHQTRATAEEYLLINAALSVITSYEAGLGDKPSP